MDCKNWASTCSFDSTKSRISLQPTFNSVCILTGAPWVLSYYNNVLFSKHAMVSRNYINPGKNTYSYLIFTKFWNFQYVKLIWVKSLLVWENVWKRLNFLLNFILDRDVKEPKKNLWLWLLFFFKLI